MHGQPMLADCHAKQASHEVIASGPEWEADLQGILDQAFLKKVGQTFMVGACSDCYRECTAPRPSTHVLSLDIIIPVRNIDNAAVPQGAYC